MLVGDKAYRTIWIDRDQPEIVRIIDQRRLPWRFEIEDLRSVADAARAIRDMHVRGAGLIGATAGYGMYLAALEAQRTPDFQRHLTESGQRLIATRPTAVNLQWAVKRQLQAVRHSRTPGEAVGATWDTARRIADEDASACEAIGRHGLELVRELAAARPDRPLRILTHCNAGWLAFVDWGSATAPIYAAHQAGLPVHVWVDETRPRNQGARLTAWELAAAGVPHTVICDNAGGHLMQTGQVDLVLTGTDRVTARGDVVNKIGTYLKALAARDCGIPFHVALPSSTIDWDTADGSDVPIEERAGDEVALLSGPPVPSKPGAGDPPPGAGMDEVEVRLCPPESPVANPAFDVTPARLVTGLITERGRCPASREGLAGLFPERVGGHSRGGSENG